MLGQTKAEVGAAEGLIEYESFESRSVKLDGLYDGTTVGPTLGCSDGAELNIREGKKL